MKSVKLEWCLGEVDNALMLLDEAVKHYPDFPKVSAGFCFIVILFIFPVYAPYLCI